MKELVVFIKRNFAKPENGLMQLLITHLLIASGILVCKIFFFLTGNIISVERFLAAYCYLSSDWKVVLYKPWTLLTYFFMPDNLLDLLPRMITFYVFGRVIVRLLGSKRLITVYFLGGITGGLSVLLAYKYAPFFQEAQEAFIHLPTAVYAVIAGAATFAPNFALQILHNRVPVKYVALVLLLFPLVGLINGHIESIAQLGSALAGSLYIYYLKSRRNSKRWHIPFTSIFTKKPSNPFSNKGKRKETTPNSQQSNTREKDLQAIFDKIAANGYASLSKEEKERLLEENE